MQNVSHGMRLPEPQKEFHAATKESISDIFIISSHLLSSLLKYVGSMQTLCLAKRRDAQQERHAASPDPSYCCDSGLFYETRPHLFSRL